MLIFLLTCCKVVLNCVVQEKYESTLLDSRLIVFDEAKKPTSDADSGKSTLQDSLDNSPSFIDPLNVVAQKCNLSQNSDDDDYLENGSDSSSLINVQSNGVDNGQSFVNSTQVLRYTSVDECPDLEEKIQEYLLSLFWVLESKRLDRSYEKLDHPTLLIAPFELRKDASVGDLDSKYE